MKLPQTQQLDMHIDHLRWIGPICLIIAVISVTTRHVVVSWTKCRITRPSRSLGPINKKLRERHSDETQKVTIAYTPFCTLLTGVFRPLCCLFTFLSSLHLVTFALNYRRAQLPRLLQRAS